MKRKISKKKSCSRKVGYSTREQAYGAMRSATAKNYTGRMNVYKCRFCKKWHFGHAPMCQEVDGWK
jgi:predicted hydrocarbon binding protein